MRMAIALTVAAALSYGVQPAFAGKDGVDSGPVFVPVIPDADVPTGAAATASRMSQAADFCSRLARKEYVIDCMAAEMEAAAADLPDTPEYAPARAALKDGARKLSKIVTDNRSASLGAGVARSSGHTSPRPIRAVDTGRMDVATDAAIGVLEETGTILLRSSRTSEDAAGFVAISTAVESNTILLRSI